MDLEVLAGRGKSGSVRDLRELVSVLGVERCHQQVNRLAQSLGEHPGSVSRWVSAGSARRSDDPGFARRLEELLDRLDSAIAAGARRQIGDKVGSA